MTVVSCGTAGMECGDHSRNARPVSLPLQTRPEEEGGGVSAANQRFGSYLRALREARRLSLEEVERLTRHEEEPISRSHLSRLENGKARFSTLKLISLSHLYGARIGTIVERLELDLEQALVEQESLDGLDSHELMQRAREAGLKGQLHRALLLYQRAELEALTSPATQERERIHARIGIARSMLAHGRHRIGRDLLEELGAEALEVAERAWVLFLLCRCYQRLEQPLMARALLGLLEEAHDTLPDEIERQMPALQAEMLGWAGRHDEALETWLRALDIARASGDALAEVVCLRQLASTERQRSQTMEAIAWAERARRLAETLGYAYHLVLIWTEIGRIQRHSQRSDLARRAFNKARGLARQIDHPRELFVIYLELWRLARTEDSGPECQSCLRTLRRLYRLIDRLPEDARDVIPLLESTPLEAQGENTR